MGIPYNRQAVQLLTEAVQLYRPVSSRLDAWSAFGVLVLRVGRGGLGGPG